MDDIETKVHTNTTEIAVLKNNIGHITNSVASIAKAQLETNHKLDTLILDFNSHDEMERAEIASTRKAAEEAEARKLEFEAMAEARAREFKLKVSIVVTAIGAVAGTITTVIIAIK